MQAHIGESEYLSPYGSMHIEERDPFERELKLERTRAERRRTESQIWLIFRVFTPWLYVIVLISMLEEAMAAKLAILEYKYPSELTLSLNALSENPRSAADIPYDSCLCRLSTMMNWGSIGMKLHGTSLRIKGNRSL